MHSVSDLLGKFVKLQIYFLIECPSGLSSLIVPSDFIPLGLFRLDFNLFFSLQIRFKVFGQETCKKTELLFSFFSPQASFCLKAAYGLLISIPTEYFKEKVKKDEEDVKEWPWSSRSRRLHRPTELLKVANKDFVPITFRREVIFFIFPFSWKYNEIS